MRKLFSPIDGGFVAQKIGETVMSKRSSLFFLNTNESVPALRLVVNRYS